MTLKEAAKLRREKSELEQKRLALKAKVKNHRDMSDDELEGVTEQLRTASERIDTINIELDNAPEQREVHFDNRRDEITEENFRSSNKYRDAFFRSFINNGVGSDDQEIMKFGKRAITDMNGGSVTSGANYLIPTTTLNVIKTIIEKYGQVYAAITKYGFTGDVAIPIGTVGAPTANGDGTKTLNFTFTEVKIQQSAVVATIKIKNLLLKNSISALEQFLATEMGKYIGSYLDNAVINGDSGTFIGIIPEIIAGISEEQNYSKMEWDELMDIEGYLDSPYGDDGIFIMRRKTFFKRFRKMTDAAGAPITTAIPIISGTGKVGFILDGATVLFTNAMVEDDVIFGDIKQYIANESQEITIETSTEVGFASDETMWRGKVYGGGRPMFAKKSFTYWTYQAV